MSRQPYNFSVMLLSSVKKLNTVGTLVAVAVFVYCLANSAAVAEGSRRYLALCADRVVPCLFVFSVLGALVSGGKGFEKLCTLSPRFGAPVALIVLGLCGGVPLGPLATLELYSRGSIGKKQAEYLCTFSAPPSLSFILSYTANALGSTQKGYALAFLTVGAAVATAVVFRPFMLPRGQGHITPQLGGESKPFSAVMASCAVNTVVICGCVVFFGSLSELMPPTLGGLMEISVGISRCTSAAQAGFFLGFSGISILCQIYAVLGRELSLAPVVAAKLFQGVLMGVGAKIFID